MSTFDEFEEQTDFSFLSLEEAPPVAVTPKKGRSVKVSETPIGINIGYVYKRQFDGYAFTTEHRENMSTSQTGRKDSPERVAKRAEANKGKKRSIEFSEHISKVRTGMKFSAEHKANLSRSLSGRKVSTEIVAKRVATLRERIANGTVFLSWAKAVMTPAGIFPSRATAANFFNISCPSMTNWMKECPEQFYYITKD